MKPKYLRATHIRDIDVCGILFPVLRAHPDDVPELVEEDRLLDGFVDFERGIIFVREGLSPTQERDTIAHETFHAFIATTGIGHLLRDRIGAEKADEFEELLVRIATPHLSKFFGPTKAGPKLVKTTAAPKKIAAKRMPKRTR